MVHSVMATKPIQAMADRNRETGRRDTLPCSGGRPRRRSRGTTSLAPVRLAGDVPGGHLGARPEPEA